MRKKKEMIDSYNESKGKGSLLVIAYISIRNIENVDATEEFLEY